MMWSVLKEAGHIAFRGRKVPAPASLGLRIHDIAIST